MLNEHPAVCMSQPKELNYFNVDDNYRRGEIWYRRHFANTTQTCGEISPLYMDSPHAAERIRAAWPDTKILVMLRNPFDRAISHLFHDASVIYGKVAALTADDMIALAGKDRKYIRRSSYATALRPYFELFPREQIGIFYFDDIRDSGEAVARRLYQFVDADDSFVPEQYDQKVNDSQDMRSAALMNALKTASTTAKRFPPTRMAMDWIYRRTQLREKVIRLVMVDKGRPEIRFEDVFDELDADTLNAEMADLETLIPSALPDTWHPFSPPANTHGSPESASSAA